MPAPEAPPAARARPPGLTPARLATAAGALCALAGVAALLGPRVGLSPPGAGSALERLLTAAPACLLAAGLALLVPAVRRRPALLAAILGLAAAGLMLAYHLRAPGPESWADRDVSGRPRGDAWKFYRMAEEWPWRPGGWWQYRLLVPWAVRTLPFDTGTGYALLALLSVGGATAVVSLLLRDLGYGDGARHLGAVLYLGSFAPLYNTFNYAMPDPAAMLVLLLAARALARRRDTELALWLLVGCVTKEVVLFLVPARWVWRRAEGGAVREAVRSAVVALPAAAAFLYLRLAGGGGAGEAVGFVAGSAFLFPWLHQPDNVARLYSPFAAGWALVALGLKRPSPWARAGIAFAVPVLLSLLVTDSGRMLVFLMPFAVPLMLDGLGAGPGTGPLTPRAAVLGGLAALSGRLWEPFVLLWKVPLPLRRGLALALAPALAFLAARREAPRP